MKRSIISNAHQWDVGLTARGPLRAILFFLMFSIAASGIAVLPSLRMGVTSTDSQATGAYEKMRKLKNSLEWI